MTNKFGPLDDEAAAQLQALGPAQLLALLDALLSFTSRADLDEWLAAQGA